MVSQFAMVVTEDSGGIAPARYTGAPATGAPGRAPTDLQAWREARLRSAVRATPGTCGLRRGWLTPKAAILRRAHPPRKVRRITAMMETAPWIQVLIVDNHPLMRRGIVGCCRKRPISRPLQRPTMACSTRALPRAPVRLHPNGPCDAALRRLRSDPRDPAHRSASLRSGPRHLC
jgi:hypothetical protein